jgi:hypothetical protein
MNKILDTMLIKWAGVPLAVLMGAVAVTVVATVLIVAPRRRVRFRFKIKKRRITVEIDAYDRKRNDR